MRRFVRVGASTVVLAAVVAAAILRTAPARAASPARSRLAITRCGQLVGADAVLRTDLHCDGDGVVVVASDITVDLGSHTVSSADGTGTGIRFGLDDTATGGTAICVQDVTVDGGAIAGFAAGLAVACGHGALNPPGLVLSRTGFTGNGFGGVIPPGYRLTADHISLDGPWGFGPACTNPCAAGLVDLSRSTITVTSPAGSGTFIKLDTGSAPATITGNTFTGWDTAVRIDTVNGLTMTGNTFRGNATPVTTCDGFGCAVFGTISSNRFLDDTGTGLSLITVGQVHIGSNVAVRNGGLGIDVAWSGLGRGLTVFDDGSNVARHNQAPQCVGVVCARH